jgi:elongation factor Ts
MCLLDQPYIRDQNISVGELVKQQVATLGENIQIRRFVRFVLGEGIEKEEVDFAAEVAAQIGATK